MQLIINNENVITGIVIIGKKVEGSIELESIPEDVKENWNMYRYVNGKFIKDEMLILPNFKASKLVELSSACEKAITAGFDVAGKHYSFTVEDQTNILAWAEQAKAGKSVPYHADGELCRVYTAAEFLQLVGAATYYKVSQQTYYNCLKQQVLALTDVDTVKAVQYGITALTGTYKETYDNIMGAIVGETAI